MFIGIQLFGRKKLKLHKTCAKFLQYQHTNLIRRKTLEFKGKSKSKTQKSYY